MSHRLFMEDPRGFVLRGLEHVIFTPEAAATFPPPLLLLSSSPFIAAGIHTAADLTYTFMILNWFPSVCNQGSASTPAAHYAKGESGPCSHIPCHVMAISRKCLVSCQCFGKFFVCVCVCVSIRMYVCVCVCV